MAIANPLLARRFSPTALAPAPKPAPAPTPTAPPAPAPVPPPATAKKGGLKKLSFAAAPKKPEETKSEYPTMPDENGEIAILSQRILERKAQLDAIEGALETDKAELKMRVGAFYFQVNQGKSAIPSGVSAIASDGLETTVLFTKRLSKPKGADKKVVGSDVFEEMLLPVLGDALSDYFKQLATLKVDCSQLPEEKAQDIVNEIIALLQRHGAGDALDITETLDCTADFHVARHTQLTPEQNMELERICPIVAQVKTKGRNS